MSSDGDKAPAAAKAGNSGKNSKQNKKGGKKGGQVKPEDFPLPEFVKVRLDLWEKIKKEQEEALKAKIEEGKTITITLKDGKQVEGKAYTTTPLDIAKGISQTLSQKCIAARVNDAMWDMDRPLEEDCTIDLYTFDTPEGKHVFWHSSAHILGQALERRYAGHLCIGPPLDDGEGGFYYDISMPEKDTVAAEHYDELKALVNAVIRQKQPFERLVLTKDQALALFAYNKYKTEIIQSKVPDGETCTGYRCGPLIDLCRGPHVPHTGRVKAFAVTKNSSAYWLGKAENDSLQRVYGISFPDNKMLKEWQRQREEAAKRDHRVLGKAQELFFFDQHSPGSPFLLPHGTRIINKMYDVVRAQYRKRGFQEVVTPNIYNSDLWKTSGHWVNYKDDMFTLECDHQDFGLKPMNCPGHCLLFKHRARSYRELPLRVADFGVLHRNELSGALGGLTRVRRFVQDDAHIFCRSDQVDSELENCLAFMESMYAIYGFTFDLELSTRPEKAIGDLKVWESAEAQLKDVLEKYSERSGKAWKLNPGDGAFYGPKIDIHITDALGRSHQCATIQLDFNLPERFQLEYATEDGTARPVMIHRAIYGSFERFLAILIEHTGGNWPLWLSPRQVLVIPVTSSNNDYAHDVSRAFEEAGFYSEVDDNDKTTLKKKMMLVRQRKMHNYVMVVGKDEVDNRSVNIRNREDEQLGAKPLEEAIAMLKQEVANFK